MSSVKIPNTYFVENIKRQYRNPKEALFREFLQNSVDAGSTKVEFFVDDNSMTCKDNGKGMDEETLIYAMLTMSGSKKGENSVGGFGEAKNLLLFAHKAFNIHTRDNWVNGECLEYNLTKGNERNGTSIQIMFHESFEFTKDEMIAIGTNYLKQCSLICNVSINGETIIGTNYGEMVHNGEWCNIFMEERAYETCYALVRKNGINMFQVYLGENHKKQFTIELTLTSKDCLSANRDSMNWKYQDKLSSIVRQIMIDKQSFGRLFNKILTFSGKVSFSKIKLMREKIADMVFPSTLSNELSALVEQLEQVTTIDEKNEIIRQIVKNDPSFSDILVSELESNFIVDIQKKGIDKLPKEYHPATMLKKYATFAKLWKACVIKVCETMETEIAFNVGWIISEDALAQFKTLENGSKVFQVNPEKHWDNDKKKMVFNLLLAACHEHVHINISGHGEDFSSAYYKTCTKVMANLSSWKEIYDCREEINL